LTLDMFRVGLSLKEAPSAARPVAALKEELIIALSKA